MDMNLGIIQEEMGLENGLEGVDLSPSGAPGQGWQQCQHQGQWSCCPSSHVCAPIHHPGDIHHPRALQAHLAQVEERTQSWDWHMEGTGATQDLQGQEDTQSSVCLSC